MGEFWTATVSNALGGLLSGILLLLAAGGFGLLVSRLAARRGNRPSTKEANTFLATSLTLSLAAVGTLVVTENSAPVLWIVGGLIVAALVVLDMLIYTLLAADWVARWKLRDEEARRRFDELTHVASVPTRPAPRRHGPGHRRRRVAAERHVGVAPSRPDRSRNWSPGWRRCSSSAGLSGIGVSVDGSDGPGVPLPWQGPPWHVPHAASK